MPTASTVESTQVEPALTAPEMQAMQLEPEFLAPAEPKPKREIKIRSTSTAEPTPAPTMGFKITEIEDYKTPEYGTQAYRRHTAFDRFDADSDGFLDISEFEASMTNWWNRKEYSTEKRERILKSATKRKDQNADGKLSRNEYVNY